MILARYRNFVTADQLQQVNHALASVPRWIYRNAHPNNCWRYYLLDDLKRYDELDHTTWYGNQTPSLSTRLCGIWRELFEQALGFAGRNFTLMRYSINGQTIGQDGVLHVDVDPAQPGEYRSYLCYLNTQWNKSWGGSTEFVGTDGMAQHEEPEPGTMIVFDSKTLHRGLAPLCNNQLRLTMGWHGKQD